MLDQAKAALESHTLIRDMFAQGKMQELEGSRCIAHAISVENMEARIQSDQELIDTLEDMMDELDRMQHRENTPS